MNRLLYVIGLVVVWGTVEVAPAAEFFVAAEGDDANVGSQAKPFATIVRAQVAVRKLLAEGSGDDIFVSVGAGVYYLDEPLLFTAADGGRGDRQVIYRGDAEADAMPTISGGLVLAKWQETPDGRWRTEVDGSKGGPWLRQLFVEGRRLPRGRFPDGEKLLKIVEIDDALQRIVVDSALPAVSSTTGSATGQGELVVHNEWGIARARVASIEDNTIATETAAGWLGHIAHTRATVGRPLYIENVPEYVDVAGEWCWEAETGQVLYQPAKGEELGSRQFVAPRLSQLLIVQGEPGKPVRNLQFVNLRFEMAAWSLPEIGYAGIQAGHFGRSLGERTWELPAAIAFTFAEGCAFEDSEVGCTGATAIALGVGCRDNRVVRCCIQDIGGNGVAIGWRGAGGSRIGELAGGASLQADWKKPEYTPVRNVVADNDIARCAQVAHGCVGIFDAFSEGTRIEHNHVHHMPYSGISIGFCWNFIEGTHRNCWVHANHVHDVMTMLADGGGIYTLGTQPGTVLSNNVIHDVLPGQQAHGNLNNGFFFDQGSKAYVVKGNCVYDVAGEPVRFNNVAQVPGRPVEFKEPIGKQAMQEWSGNSFGAKPGELEFPQTTADAAGPRSR